MKKTAIISLYYKNRNYGGLLQAYALCTFLRKNGILAEQIMFDAISHKKSFLAKSKIIVKQILRFLKLYKKDTDEYFEKRDLLFDKFMKRQVPHTRKVYISENINKCVSKYDIFITGSDQVWNFDWYREEYFLDFVPGNKSKIAYAVSTGKDNFTKEQNEIFKESLKDYKAVSVREENMVDNLKELISVRVECVVDPVLLLDSNDWDKISSGRVCNEPYVFCYFLGDNEKSRQIAKEFARKNGMKVLSIPMKSDEKTKAFGDFVVNDASPEDFLSFIKYAQYVFTDSFHASVFSVVYKKEFFVFNRNSYSEMSSRIVTLVDMFDLGERFCNTSERENLSYIESVDNIDYSKNFEKFDIMKKRSVDFLLINLEIV